MSAREYLENSRNLAERILRLAVAAVLWWSGQTKAEGFSTREETFYLFREEYKVPLLPSQCRRLPEHRRQSRTALKPEP